ncbi:EcoAI/FtnUII family type I restriction enzme subunit R [Halanaerobium congolense]|jgi:type I restriction enzyme R subunit|uniref:Type I restriction enzyme R subunit n=1 Tax=Halanaerobium congolense TaxID=54121 RepID=A0A1M7KSW9_9FIRM|nr:DEAD/DEAH box helicase family protein [Halanaerobium congolense]TDX38297.1 type I restriction enzyme R subunit [Halanaerobium congolense]SDH21476.1 type I restriction enzyme, R subunit [Halanaerobium congolense]SHM68549.1 type I restriction enzyme, R subunit [Halanaerobium congolense]
MTDKKSMTESEICMNYITPAIKRSGWDKKRQIRREYYFTAGRIVVRGKATARKKGKKADYLLEYKSNFPLAVVEAKSNQHSIGSGMQQALDYAEILDVPFVYASNGDAFIEHDRTTGKVREISLSNFPSPKKLWDRYKDYKNYTEEEEEIVTQDYYYAQGGKTPRYYQRVAINRTVEAIAKGQDRIMLVMATGTGKTFTAFQIIHRLWKAREKKRILFLADRNILIDQAMVNDFNPFKDIMQKVDRNTVDKAHEIYMALYQSMTGSEEWQETYRQFSPDFFDLVVIDECHRGSARADSAWREVLDYFDDATHIGLTATPKETNKVSNTHYFGEPIYTYSLKQGIDDGYLAPYKVVRVNLDKDLEGYRPTKDKLDKYGLPVEDREYNIKDYDRSLVLEKRTELVAKEVSDYLKPNSRYNKSIVFCVDIDHAERMRQSLINENSDLVKKNSKYVMAITSEHQRGKEQLTNFTDPAEKYPTLVTTSKLLTTGVDAQTCKLIVLDANINSMTEFKQIIGRGTRINEDYNKRFFTIMDFRGVTRKFADPEFDGEPVQEGEFEPGELTDSGDGNDEDGDIIIDPEGSDDNNSSVKYFLDDVEVHLISEKVQYYDKDGKLVTESLIDYTRKNVREHYDTLNDFIRKWNSEDKKQAIIEELENQGIFLEELKEEVGKDMDEFDLICHIAYDKPPLTRQERADKVEKSDYFAKYGEEAREVIKALLDKYRDDGVTNIEDMKVLQLEEFRKIGSPKKIIKSFGSRQKYEEAIKDLENKLYA